MQDMIFRLNLIDIIINIQGTKKISILLEEKLYFRLEHVEFSFYTKIFVEKPVEFIKYLFVFIQFIRPPLKPSPLPFPLAGFNFHKSNFKE